MIRDCVSTFAHCFWALIMAGIFGRTPPAECAQIFRNLGFENAQIICLSGGFPSCEVAVSNALPSWIAAIDDVPISRVVLDEISLGCALISIHDTNGVWPPAHGDFWVALQSSWDGTVVPSISQTGSIPFTAKSLSFVSGSEAQIKASFNQDEILLTEIGDPAHPHTWGGDVSQFAGQTGVLKFWGNGWLDDVAFSSDPILWPPTLSVPKVDDSGTFQFLLAGHAGQTYTVHVSTNLINWFTLTNVAGSADPVTISDSTATNAPVRFYRTVSP